MKTFKEMQNIIRGLYDGKSLSTAEIRAVLKQFNTKRLSEVDRARYDELAEKLRDVVWQKGIKQ